MMLKLLNQMQLKMFHEEIEIPNIYEDDISFKIGVYQD